MSSTQYDLKRGVLLQPTVMAPSIPASKKPVINLEQRLLAKMERSGLMLALSFDNERLNLYLVGTLSRGAVGHLKEFVSQLFQKGYYQIKVDLNGVTQIDGNGMAALTWMTVHAKERSGQVLICNPRQSVRNLMLAIQAQFMLEISDYELVAS